MSRAPHNSQLPQDIVGIEALGERRSDCATGLGDLSQGLVSCMRRPAPDSAERAFFCRSDLKSLWTRRLRPGGPRPLDAIFHALSEAQREAVFNHLLLFISFLVYVDISPEWCAGCEARLFKPKWSPERSTDLEFDDAGGALSEDELRRLGLSATQAVKWERQFMFRPAKITLNDDDLDEWIQVIDRREPLPFELSQDREANLGHSIGYDSEHGNVEVSRSSLPLRLELETCPRTAGARGGMYLILTFEKKLYRISSEYVSLVRQDSDGTEIRAPASTPVIFYIFT